MRPLPLSAVIAIRILMSLFSSRESTAPAALEGTPPPATDYLIAGLVAAFVFVFFGRALPRPARGASRVVANERIQASERTRFDSTRLSKGQAIAISAGFMAGFAACISLHLHIVVALAILLTSLWASADSERIQLRTYKTRIALHPLIFFNAMMWLWPILFPWYLIVCTKIGAGTMIRR